MDAIRVYPDDLETVGGLIISLPKLSPQAVDLFLNLSD
jgi:hypothetical protein